MDSMQTTDSNLFDLSNVLHLDVETTNIEKGSALNPDNRLVLACWEYRGTKYECYADEYHQQLLVQHISECSLLVAFNSKFELQWLKRCGVALETVDIYCTQIAEYVRAGNRSWGMYPSLDGTCGLYGMRGKESLVTLLIKGGVCPSEIPKNWLIEYCHLDVDRSRAIFDIQYPDLEQRGLLPCQYTRCFLTPMLADIEFNGCHVDHDTVMEEYHSAHRDWTASKLELDTYMGGVNPNSPPQMGEYLYDILGFAQLKDSRGKAKTTSTGNRCTDKVTIGLLKARTAEQTEFLKLLLLYKENNARLTKTLNFLREVVENREGIFYAKFNQTATKTHRLSSTGIRILCEGDGKHHSMQFQNFPRALKYLFTARNPDWDIVEADGAGMEFRGAVFLARDYQGYADIVNGVDIHNATACTLTEAGEETNRQDAKEHTFKPLYGGMDGTPAQREYYRYFRDRYSGVSKWQEAMGEEACTTGKVRTEFGLSYYYPGTRKNRYGGFTGFPKICNYSVQGGATAEIIPASVGIQWRMMKVARMQSFIVNTVHDSTIGEVHPDETELYQSIAKHAFTTETYDYLKRVYDIEFSVPLAVETKTGKQWSKGEESKYEPDCPYEFKSR